MGDKPYHIKEARRWFDSLQTRDFSLANDVGCYAEYMRKELAQAGATLKDLDPDGKHDDEMMERVLAGVVKAAYLRGARKEFEKLETSTASYDSGTADFIISNARKLLAAGGYTLADLDPAGKAGAAEIEKRLEAGKRRICLQKARYELKEFETSTCAAWGDMTEGIIGGIRRNVALAGAALSALDPGGASSDAAIEKRLAAAETRLQILYAKAQLAEAEEATSCYFPDSAFRPRENIVKTIEKLQASGPAAGTEASMTIEWFKGAEAQGRLAAAERKMCRLGATRAIADMQKELDGTEKGYAGSMRARLRELDRFLQHIGGQAALAEPGSAAAFTYASTIGQACLKAGGEELEAFENMAAPKALAEIDDRAAHIAALFNRAGKDSVAGLVLEGNTTATVGERMDEASARARNLYYAAGGKLPVMKRIRLNVPQAGAG